VPQFDQGFGVSAVAKTVSTIKGTTKSGNYVDYFHFFECLKFKVLKIGNFGGMAIVVVAFYPFPDCGGIFGENLSMTIPDLLKFVVSFIGLP
jgi:hypothetical protein